MIIIGSTQLTFTRDTGTFHCPNCDQTRSYRHRHQREFLTVYFIPLIPLQKLGEFLECQTCRQTFAPEIAQMTAEQVRASQRRGVMEKIRRVLVVIVAVDEQVTDEELAEVSEFARQHDLPEVSGEQVLREASTARRSGMDPRQYIAHVAGQLSESDRDLLVEHAFLAATAGGELSPARESLLKELPEATGIEPWRFREIIDRAAGST